MGKASTIILCAGPINFLDLPVATNRSNAMVPVSGKPVISWILDDLLEKGIRHATVVLRAENHHLRRFVERAYARRMDVVLVETDSKSINESLCAGLRATPATELVRIVLGDTLIRDSYSSEVDFLYTAQVESSRKWCVVRDDVDGTIVEYLDKKGTATTSMRGAAGYYHLLDGAFLGSCVDAAVAAGERELSDVLRRYGAQRTIKAKLAAEWFDFGHIEALVDARHRLITSRHFNSVRVDPLLKTITKISDDDAKLRDERDWYHAIPNDLKVLCPRILREVEVDGRLQMTQEYYGYPTLAELYLYGDLQLDTWSSILRYVLRIQAELQRHPGTIPADDVRFMYDDKVAARIDALRAQGGTWPALLEAPTIRFNGEELRNLPPLGEAMRARAKSLATSAKITVMHGDLCFSNILFDINNQIIRLIDPRGSFATKGVFGDPRYDVAKLRHSASGCYDYMMSDLFTLDERDGGYHATIHQNDSAEGVARELDRLLEAGGWSLDEIRFVEALLFVSMVPLHRDHPRRQLLMYLTGVKLLNEVLDANPR